MSKIEYIDVDKIYPHPDNPRKDLGDLTELAESIKVSGVLQNLTLVPRDKDTYTVIIGHRRLAASKLAGLAKVPCIVTEMDEKEQAATMLVENMQRNDLTVYEQAQGFQMMFDLGETIDTLSEKTGFSKKTIKSRTKLLELDKEKFQAAMSRGATLMDYEKLSKIKDPELKNKVLDTIGTKNFEWTLKNAISEEKAAARKEEIIKTLQGFAAETKECTGLRYVKRYYYTETGEIVPPEDAGKRKYFYFVCTYGVDVYRHYTADEKRQSKEENKKNAELRKEQEQFSYLAKKAFELRRDFVKGLYVKKKQTETIMQFAIWSFAQSSWGYGRIVTPDDFCQYCDLPDNEKKGLFQKLAHGDGKLPTEKALLIMAYCNFHDSEREKYNGFNGDHCENKKLDTLYEFLEKLGYELSDTERELKDGTHALYANADNA